MNKIKVNRCDDIGLSRLFWQICLLTPLNFHTVKKHCGKSATPNNLDGLCQDVARLWQEEGGHCLLVGKGRIEVVQHLVQDRVDDSLKGGLSQVKDDS